MKLPNPDEMDLEEIDEQVREIALWLDKAFSADCVEEEYAEGCASCDAGAAIRALAKITKALRPFTEKPSA